MVAAPDNTILLAGFEPFGEFTVNPSELVARELDGEVIGGCTIKSIVLPVVFGEAGDTLIEAINDFNPKLVICLGLAADRKEISIERLAVNLDDARMPDNAGSQPVDQLITLDGPSACWSTLPVKDLVATLQEQGIPSSLSMSAGTFVCNHVFYRLMQCLDGNSAIRGGFIHLPTIRDQPDPGGISLDNMLGAVRMSIDTTLRLTG